MFGYVLLNPKSASDEEKKRYAQYYCGLCKALEAGYGRTATKALSYDMTFLYMLLADLYNQEGTVRKSHCQIHPISRREYLDSPLATYSADMQLLLAYYSAMDRVKDDGDSKALSFCKSLEDGLKRCEAKYPRQSAAVKENLELITRAELEGERDAEIPSGYFASLMGEIFVPYSDQWAANLRLVGEGLGRFVYLLDAWDDLEKDKKKERYNPYLAREKDEALYNEVREEMTIAASSAAEALERLPLDENLSILRNILYSGIWTKFVEKKK